MISSLSRSSYQNRIRHADERHVQPCSGKLDGENVYVSYKFLLHTAPIIENLGNSARRTEDRYEHAFFNIECYSLQCWNNDFPHFVCFLDAFNCEYSWHLKALHSEQTISQLSVIYGLFSDLYVKE